MGKIRNRIPKYESRIQIRISSKLKEKVIYKCNNENLSDYIRKLIEKDCEDIEIYDVEDI